MLNILNRGGVEHRKHLDSGRTEKGYPRSRPKAVQGEPVEKTQKQRTKKRKNREFIVEEGIEKKTTTRGGGKEGEGQGRGWGRPI